MKVVTRESVANQILGKLVATNRAGNIPEYILVTPEEYRELRSDMRTCSMMSFMSHERLGDPSSASLRFIDLDHRSGRSERRYRFAQTTTFQGLPLYVVPEEYIN